MPLEEFTPAELEKLAEFDAARNERVPFAEEPLTPTGPIVYPHEMVPHPMAQPDGYRTGTAEEWARAEAARAWAQRGLSWHLVSNPSLSSKTPEEMHDYIAEHSEWVDQFSIWFLLRHVSDDVVRELGEILDAGDCLDEMLWDWLNGQGIDAKRIRSFPTRAEAIERQTQRRAEREAQRAGGQS